MSASSISPTSLALKLEMALTVGSCGVKFHTFQHGDPRKWPNIVFL